MLDKMVIAAVVWAKVALHKFWGSPFVSFDTGPPEQNKLFF